MHALGHSGNCVRGLFDVFDVSKRPWVNLVGAPVERVIEQVKHCPSGALQSSVSGEGTR